MTKEIRWNNIKYEIYQSHSFQIPMILKYPHSPLFARYSSYLQLTPHLVDRRLSKPFVKVAHSAGQRHSSQLLQKYTVFKLQIT